MTKRPFNKTILLLPYIIITIKSFTPTISPYIRQFKSASNQHKTIRNPIHYLGSTKDKQKAVLFDPMPITIYLSNKDKQATSPLPDEWFEMFQLLDNENDPYKILQMKNTKVDHKEIKRAYRRMARKFHPDMVDDDHKKIANELFSKINVAYDMLTSCATPTEMEEILNCEDAYKILDLTPKGRVTRDEVKRAYKKRVMRYHPDVIVDVGDNKRLARKVVQKIHAAAESILMEKKSFIQKGMGGAVHTSSTHRRYKPPPCDGSASWGQRRPVYNVTETDGGSTTYVKAKVNRPPPTKQYHQQYQSQSTYQRPSSQSFYDKPPTHHQAVDTHWSNPRRHEAMEPTIPLRNNRFHAKSNDQFTSSYTPPHRASNTATGVNYNSSFQSPHAVNGKTHNGFRRNAYAAPDHTKHPTNNNDENEPSTTQGTQGHFSSTTNVSGHDFEIRKLLWHIHG